MSDPTNQSLKPQPPTSWGFAAVCGLLMLAAVVVVWMVNTRDAANVRQAPAEKRQ